MKKYEVTIEETCCETFLFEIQDDVDIIDYVSENYYDGEIVLENGECQSRQMEIHDLDKGSHTDWIEF